MDDEAKSGVKQREIGEVGSDDPAVKRFAVTVARKFTVYAPDAKTASDLTMAAQRAYGPGAVENSEVVLVEEIPGLDGAKPR